MMCTGIDQGLALGAGTRRRDYRRADGLEGATVLPHQFAELAARVHTKASLRDATHFYLTSETPTHLNIEQQDVRPFTNTMLANDEVQVFRPWDSRQFAVRAARFTRLDESVFIDAVTGVEMTTLTNLFSGDDINVAVNDKAAAPTRR